MDGNGRWATQRGFPRLEGHRVGVDRIHKVLETLGNKGVRYVTLYAFSTENWNRPADEVQGLLEILYDALQNQTRELHDNNVRILHIGKTDGLSPELQEAVTDAQELTRENSGITLNVAFNYGGRDEILEAVKRLVRDGVAADDIDEALFSKYLFTGETPGPGPDNTHRRRDAHQQLSAVAIGLQRVLPHPYPLARPGLGRVGTGPGGLRQPPTALRQG